MSTVKLSMPVLLPLIFAAHAEKKLQAQNPGKIQDACLYDGPCAIGVGIPETQRARLDRDDAPEITFLIRDGKVKIGDGEAISEYGILQGIHDQWRYDAAKGSGELSEQKFLTYLVTLSKKHGVEIPDGYDTDS